jgi:transposase
VSSIVPLINNKKIYLYLSTSFRNDKGKPDTTKKCIGNVDSITNDIIFNNYYIEYAAKNNIDILKVKKDIITKLITKQLISSDFGTQFDGDCSDDNEANFNVKDYDDSVDNSKVTDIFTYTTSDLDNCSCKHFGITYFLDKIAEKVGLNDILSRIFPLIYTKILTLIYFLLSTEDPFMYCEEWCKNTVTNIQSHEMASQRISELLDSIEFNDKINFYSKWCNLRMEKEYCATDITSISSYSNLIEYVESGYNREGDKLKQINLCMVFGEQSGLPIFSIQYPGSMSDVSTLTDTLDHVSILRDNNFKLVMDKGFYSKNNILYMIKNSKIDDFIIAVPFKNNFTKKYILNSENIVNDLNIISLGSDVLYYKLDTHQFTKDNKLNLYIYYNQALHINAKNELIKKAYSLLEMIKLRKISKKHFNDIKKYLIIPENDDLIYKRDIKINFTRINDETKYTGWLIALSNQLHNPTNVINIYRSKDVVEKGFEHLKERLENRRIRVHSIKKMDSKLFISFIAHIILCYINKIMQDNNLYSRYTLKELLQKLNTIVMKTIKHNIFINELTATQKEIFKIFDIPAPDRKSRL